MDGHTGTASKQINQGGSGAFSVIMTYLAQSSGHCHYIVHASSNEFSSSGLQPLQFLASVGLEPFQGQCPFHHDRCCWRDLGSVAGGTHDAMVAGPRFHDAFKVLADNLGNLFDLERRRAQLVNQMRLDTRAAPIFGDPLRVKIDPAEAPPWAEEIKFPRLLELETQRHTIQREIADLSEYLALVYATGEVLESAVIKALQALGLEVSKTEPGFTADMLAQSMDQSKHFGIEVTGISGAIKKDSKKLTQVLEFERIKENNEKTILVANTHRDVAVSQRPAESFTPQVVQFLSTFPILLMTGWDLYRMVRDVLVGSAKKDELAALLHDRRGVLVYPP